MTVICLTNCPPKLRGDLTKWLMEINTGVYVGNISARVREELWNRIIENIRSGQATMVFRSSGEQHMDFRVHNTTWKPVDYDGLKLIMRPSPVSSTYGEDEQLHEGFSKAARISKARQMQRSAQKRETIDSYTVLDLETTGLHYTTGNILEIAALRIRGGIESESFSCLVRSDEAIPREVCELTGITDDLVQKTGLPLKTALEELLAFIGSDRLLCWNADFDISFLQIGCNKCGLPVPRNKTVDAFKLIRKTIRGLPDYRLTTAAMHYGIETKDAHRALPDCHLTHAVYAKLIEKQSDEE